MSVKKSSWPGRDRPTLPLTARQREVLKAIGVFIKANGYPPTLRELGAVLGIKSTNGVDEHLRSLAAKGYIERKVALVSRGIRLTGKAAC